MEAFGGIVVVIILGIAAWSLAMRAAGRRDIPDNLGKGMLSWVVKRFIK